MFSPFADHSGIGILFATGDKSRILLHVKATNCGRARVLVRRKEGIPLSYSYYLHTEAGEGSIELITSTKFLCTQPRCCSLSVLDCDGRGLWESVWFSVEADIDSQVSQVTWAPP